MSRRDDERGRRAGALQSGETTPEGTRRDFYPTSEYPEVSIFKPVGRHVLGPPRTEGPGVFSYAAKTLRGILPRSTDPRPTPDRRPMAASRAKETK